jgi:hypothetical protein
MKKQFYKKLSSLVFLLLASSFAFAQTFTLDGINYNVISPTAVEVIANNPEYNGDITIPSTVTNIGEAYSVTQIGVSAFANCSLTSIFIPNTIVNIKMAAFYKTSLTNIFIPTSVISIENQAFIGCNKLTSINIPNSLTSIGDKVFAGCPLLTSIIIPTSVTSIGDSIFWLCTGLKSLIVNRSSPLIITETIFQDIYTTATLYVPAGTKAAYQAAAEWNRFTNIVESPINSIEPFNTSNFTIYPNPAIENVTITLTESVSGSISIIDLQGNVVLNKSLLGNTSNISTSDLASGVYVVKINSDKGVAVKQLVIE